MGPSALLPPGPPAPPTDLCEPAGCRVLLVVLPEQAARLHVGVQPGGQGDQRTPDGLQHTLVARPSCPVRREHLDTDLTFGAHIGWNILVRK